MTKPVSKMIIILFYLNSPDGKKCRSKPQMMQYLPEDFDMELFDFRAGKNVDQLLKKRKRRKDDFNFCKDFDISGSSSAKRQPKKVKETITVNVLNQEDLEGDKSENKEITQCKLDMVLYLHIKVHNTFKEKVIRKKLFTFFRKFRKIWNREKILFLSIWESLFES